ncbi:cysteine dioxygenase family protein [Streptosporangiaceae bacterium NEAU-GS5]|nr:cysteine dioxygenase family protein [Streptosporangiaceae bacterium NEAU-GS5]
MTTLVARPEHHRSAAELQPLVTAVRGAVGRGATWQDTSRYVADELRRHLPSPGVLTARQQEGEPDAFGSHLLHVEPDGTFSMLAIVWRPGQETRIHDHITWCVFGVLQGVEHEDLYTLSEDGTHLVDAGVNANLTGEVSGFAPPGDIHRVRNVTGQTAISLHIYGTDLARIGSSVRRYYDLPIRSGASAG